MPDSLDPSVYRDLVHRALEEDVGTGDVTTHAVVPTGTIAIGVFLAKQPCVVSGLGVARDVFTQVDPAVEFDARKHDGDRCEAGETLARVGGRAGSMLTAERTALNFLQHLSGVATLTRAFVDAAGGTLQILDTRKTTPMLRALEKYAVRCGGGTNHRMGLYDGVLIKDNHIRLGGGIAKAVARAREQAAGLKIEVEVQSLDQVDEALAAGADAIMLDNLDDETVRTAVGRIAGRARVELSGGMTLERVRVLASVGADCASVGALTHSAQAADISFEIEEKERRAEGKGQRAEGG
jgi:nicotinate-nucleotide pyrophosphorylase (carboxylating)